MKTSLDQLALVHGTDKASNAHAYTPIYEKYFSHLRDEPILLVEYGVGGYDARGVPCSTAGGASLRMWADWLPKATIVGVDNCPKQLDFGGRDIHLYLGDQTDYHIADVIADRHGGFDIVIDDASHLSRQTIDTFRSAWRHLKPGGFYVLEDTANSYYTWAGPLHSSNDPDRPLHNGDPTMMQFMRRMADDVNWRDYVYPVQFWRGYKLEFAHFWHELVILRKAPDA